MHYLFAVGYVLVFSVFFHLTEGVMLSTGSLCSLIRATNLGQMANYGWECSDDDCSDATTFALTPPSKGTCDGGELVEIRLVDTNNVAAFEGTIPATFGEITAPLRTIEFQTNKLFGSIPFNMGEIHTTLSYFDISDNKLTGTIPSSFCDITALTTLKFGDNDNLFCYAHCLSSIADLSPGAVAQCAAPTAMPSTAAPTAVPSTAAPTYAPTPVPSTATPTAVPTTATPTSVPTRSDVNIPADIYSTTLSDAPTSTSIEVDLIVSKPAVAYCKAYNSGVVPASSAEILFDNRQAPVVSNAASIELDGLAGVTSHDVYCLTVSNFNIPTGMGTVLLQPLSNVSTACCKTLSVTLFADRQVVDNAYLRSIEVSWSDLPSDNIEISIVTTRVDNVANRNGISVIALGAISISNDTSLMRLDFDTSVDNSGFSEGEYELEVTLTGRSAAEFSIVFPRGNSIIVHHDASIADAGVQCAYSPDGRFIELVFGVNTDRGGFLNAFNCSTLLTFAGVAEASCRWKTDSTLQISPAHNSSSTSLTLSGENVTVLGGTLHTKCSFDCTTTNNIQTILGFDIAVTAPATPLKPTPVLRAPLVIGKHESPLVLDLSASSGSLGRAWQTPEFTVLTQPDVDKAVPMRNFLRDHFDPYPASITAESLPIPAFLGTVTVDPEVVSYGQWYIISVSLCNVLGECGVDSVTIETHDNNTMLRSSIVGPSRRRITRGDGLRLAANVSSFHCGDPYSSSDADSNATNHQLMSHEWAFYVNDALVEISNDSLDSAELLISPFVLTVGTLYTIELMSQCAQVGFIDTLTGFVGNSSISSVSVFVNPGSLTPVVTGASSDMVVIYGESLTLDGSSSYDEDIGSATASDAYFQFLWSCTQIDPFYFEGCVLSLTDQSLATVTIAVSDPTAVGTTSRVILTVSDATRSAAVDVTITVVDVDTVNPSSTQVLIDSPVRIANPVTYTRGVVTAGTAAEITDAGSEFVLSGVVSTNSLVSGTATWSINDPEVDLAAVAHSGSISTAVVSPYASGTSSDNSMFSQRIYLPLDLALLPAEGTFVVSLSYSIPNSLGVLSSAVEISLNSPPELGFLSVVPGLGVAGETIFTASALNWVDDNLPLSFQFTVCLRIDCSTGVYPFDLAVLQPRSSTAVASTVLPAGLVANDYNQTLFVQVWDALGSGYTTAGDSVTVLMNSNFTSLSERVYQDLYNAEGSVQQSKRVISTSATLINLPNCSAGDTVDTDSCASLNREPCSFVSFTCGDCLSGFVGDLLDPRGSCRTVPSSGESLMLGDDSLSESCSATTDCPFGKQCVSGTCTLALKSCPMSCHGNGQCLFANINTGADVDSCYGNDISCYAFCNCDSNSGNACADTDSVDIVGSKSSLRDALISRHAWQVRSESPSVTSVISWMQATTVLLSTPAEVTPQSAMVLLELSTEILTHARVMHAPVRAVADFLRAVSVLTLRSVDARSDPASGRGAARADEEDAPSGRRALGNRANTGSFDSNSSAVAVLRDELLAAYTKILLVSQAAAPGSTANKYISTFIRAATAVRSNVVLYTAVDADEKYGSSVGVEIPSTVLEFALGRSKSNVTVASEATSAELILTTVALIETVMSPYQWYWSNLTDGATEEGCYTVVDDIASSAASIATQPLLQGVVDRSLRSRKVSHFLSNPLKLTVMLANGDLLNFSDTSSNPVGAASDASYIASFSYETVVEVDFYTIATPEHNITTVCELYDYNTRQSLTCSYDNTLEYEIVHQCNGNAETFYSVCPTLQEHSQCYRLLNGTVVDIGCVNVNNGACNCPLPVGLFELNESPAIDSDGASATSLEIVAMKSSYLVIIDRITIHESIEQEPALAWSIFGLVLVSGAGIACTLLVFARLGVGDTNENKATVSPPPGEVVNKGGSAAAPATATVAPAPSVPAPGGGLFSANLTPKALKQAVHSYLRATIPAVFHLSSQTPAWRRLLSETFKHHRYFYWWHTFTSLFFLGGFNFHSLTVYQSTLLLGVLQWALVVSVVSCVVVNVYSMDAVYILICGLNIPDVDSFMMEQDIYSRVHCRDTPSQPSFDIVLLMLKIMAVLSVFIACVFSMPSEILFRRVLQAPVHISKVQNGSAQPPKKSVDPNSPSAIIAAERSRRAARSGPVHSSLTGEMGEYECDVEQGKLSVVSAPSPTVVTAASQVPMKNPRPTVAGVSLKPSEVIKETRWKAPWADSSPVALDIFSDRPLSQPTTISDDLMDYRLVSPVMDTTRRRAALQCTRSLVPVTKVAVSKTAVKLRWKSIRKAILRASKCSTLPVLGRPGEMLPFTAAQIIENIATQYDILRVMSDHHVGDATERFEGLHREWCIKYIPPSNTVKAFSKAVSIMSMILNKGKVEATAGDLVQFDEGSNMRARIAATVDRGNERLQSQLLKYKYAMNSSSIGVDLLFLFIEDLLGQQSPAANAFRAKVDYSQEAHGVSLEHKTVGYVLCLVLIIGCSLDTALMLSKGEYAWQGLVLVACIFQIAFEVLLVETILCVITHYVIPSQFRTEIDKIWPILFDLVDKLGAQSETVAVQRSVGADEATTEAQGGDSMVDVPSYFYPSSALATLVEFQDTLEAQLIRLHRTYCIGEMATGWQFVEGNSQPIMKSGKDKKDHASAIDGTPGNTTAASDIGGTSLVDAVHLWLDRNFYARFEWFLLNLTEEGLQRLRQACTIIIPLIFLVMAFLIEVYPVLIALMVLVCGFGVYEYYRHGGAYSFCVCCASADHGEQCDLKEFTEADERIIVHKPPPLTYTYRKELPPSPQQQKKEPKPVTLKQLQHQASSVSVGNFIKSAMTQDEIERMNRRNRKIDDSMMQVQLEQTRSRVDSPLKISPDKGLGLGGEAGIGLDVYSGEVEWQSGGDVLVPVPEPVVVEQGASSFNADMHRYNLMDANTGKGSGISNNDLAPHQAQVSHHEPSVRGGGRTPVRPAVLKAAVATFQRPGMSAAVPSGKDKSLKSGGGSPAAARWRSLKAATSTTAAKPETPPWRKEPQKPDFFYIEGEIHVSDDEKMDTEGGNDGELKLPSETSGSASISESTLSNHPTAAGSVSGNNATATVSFNIKKES